MLALLLLLPAGRTSAAGEPANDDTAAKIHYDAGRALYEAGRYKEALREFDAAFQASGRAALLYNMGRCHEKLGDEKEAIRAYEDFLAEDPHSGDRANLERHIAALKEHVYGVEQGLHPLEPARTARAARAGRPLRFYPFIVGGLGLGLLASAIGTGVVAQKREQSLSDRCPMNLCSTVDPVARDLHDEGHRLAIATDVLVGVGSVAVVAGIVTLVIEVRRAGR